MSSYAVTGFMEQWKSEMNILNAYKKVKSALNGSLIETEAFEWEWNLSKKVKEVQGLIEKCFSNEDLDFVIHSYYIPKNSGKPRECYYVPFDFEVLWISFLNVVGPHIDRIMPRYSFGYRLWRPLRKNLQTGRWEYGDYSVPSDEIYTSFNRSYKNYRRFQKIFLHNLLKLELDSVEEELLEEENRKQTSEGRISKGTDVWKEKFPLFDSRYVNTCGKDIENLFYIKLDLKDFFPSIKQDKLVEQFGSILARTELGNDAEKTEKIEKIKQCFVKLLSSRRKPLIEPEKNDSQTPTVSEGIPIGMLAAGFLANIYLFPLDEEIDEYVKGIKKFDDNCENTLFGYFRYVDDIVLIADSPKSLVKVTKVVEQKLEELGLTINLEKLKPNLISEYIKQLKFKEPGFSITVTECLEKLFNLISQSLSKEEFDALLYSAGLEDILEENIESEEDINEILGGKVKEHFEITPENYHDFQTAVFNEMSELSNMDFVFEDLDEVESSFQRARNLIRSFMDEDKIAPQTRISFSTHIMMKMIRSLLILRHYEKFQTWSKVEDTLSLQPLSECLLFDRKKSNIRKIEKMISNVLDDVRFAILNAPSKTKLLKRFVEYILFVHDAKKKEFITSLPNPKLVDFLELLEKKITIDVKTKHFLCFEFLKYVKEILYDRLNANKEVPRGFLDDVVEFLDKLILRISDETQQEGNINRQKIYTGVQKDPMILAEMLEILLILETLGVEIDSRKISMLEDKIDKLRGYNSSFNTKLQKKMNLYKTLVKGFEGFATEGDRYEVCFHSLNNLCRLAKSKVIPQKIIRALNEMLINLATVYKGEKDDEFDQFCHVLTVFYFSVKDKEIKKKITDISLELLLSMSSDDSSNFDDSTSVLKLNKILLTSVYDCTFNDTYDFRTKLTSLRSGVTSVFSSNASEFLMYSCLEKKETIEDITAANFLNLYELSYGEKIFLSLLFCALKGKIENYLKVRASTQKSASIIPKYMVDDLFVIKINARNFKNVFERFKLGRESIENVSELQKHVLVGNERASKRSEYILKFTEVIKKKDADKVYADIEWLTWILLGIFGQRRVTDGIDLNIEIEKSSRYMLKNIWRTLIQEQVVSTKIAEVLANNIGVYSYPGAIKPYSNSEKSYEKALLKEFERVLGKSDFLKIIHLPPIEYGSHELRPFLRVGIFQPTVDYFGDNKKHINPHDFSYDDYIIENVMMELGIALSVFKKKAVDLILAPELSIPREIEGNLIDWCKKYRVISIYGSEYRYFEDKNRVANEYKIVWPFNEFDVLHIRGKKRFFNFVEKEGFKGKADIDEAEMVSLFISKDIGNFSILVCYDTTDIQTLASLKGKVETIFVPAYNRDVNTFTGIADSMSKIVYCNFVIANVGTYGGSIVRIPYYDPHKREALTISGNGIFGAQVVDIPIKHLRDFRTLPEERIVTDGEKRKFKAFPPRYDAWVIDIDDNM
ncbi:MAG: RNA-directed DNA polymerase [Fervidobacterium sp.]|uniref:RNA-directed DNA polymerase n=1 Tax=Fervidobacterium sp. TaxID=1871331 RepID=UPI0025C15065|nr:RNA-directed DNA polymerase [Fervidobacterium sp.]NPU88335.1 RNA-directed DNA polymerase [Fervidobacterium sp.]